jgi:hypothetical protein
MTSAAQAQGISTGSKEEPVIASDKSQSLAIQVQRPSNLHGPTVARQSTLVLSVPRIKIAANSILKLIFFYV